MYVLAGLWIVSILRRRSKARCCICVFINFMIYFARSYPDIWNIVLYRVFSAKLLSVCPLKTIKKCRPTRWVIQKIYVVQGLLRTTESSDTLTIGFCIRNAPHHLPEKTRFAANVPRIILYCIVLYLFKKSIIGDTASRYRTSHVSTIYYIKTYAHLLK
jgi:hypothetical protein